jgi:hypothetical protein
VKQSSNEGVNPITGTRFARKVRRAQKRWNCVVLQDMP